MFVQILKNDMTVIYIADEKEHPPVEDGKVINIIRDVTGIEVGMTYDPDTKEFYYPEPDTPVPADQRREAYQTLTIIEWHEQTYTVDEANKAYLEYLAEGSAKADELQVLIAAAKEYIREEYPDKEES